MRRRKKPSTRGLRRVQPNTVIQPLIQPLKTPAAVLKQMFDHFFIYFQDQRCVVQGFPYPGLRHRRESQGHSVTHLGTSKSSLDLAVQNIKGSPTKTHFWVEPLSGMFLRDVYIYSFKVVTRKATFAAFYGANERLAPPCGTNWN